MIERHEQLVAYLSTLAALIFIYVATLVAASISPGIIGKLEAFGIGTITGGLIGLLRLPSARNVTVDNSPSDPVPTQDADK